MSKRITSLLLAVVMVFSLVPAVAASAEATGESIVSVKVSGVTTPIAGATPDFDITFNSVGALLDDGEYYDAVVWWSVDNLGNWNQLDESSTFAPGIYELDIYLIAEDGYVFTDDTMFYVDEEVLPPEWDITDSYVSVYWNDHYCAEIYIYFIIEPEEPSTVTFEAGGGSGTMVPVTDARGFYTLPECGFIAPAGKVFKCWSVDGVEMYPGDEIFVTTDFTVTAVWEQTLTITFGAGGGSGTMAPVVVRSGSYTLPECDFTAPAGKVFKCWSVDGSEMAVGDKITVTADTAVTAVWVIPIDTIVITGITVPVTGEKAVTAGITVHTEGLTIRTMHWLRAGTAYHMVNDLFEANKTYPLLIYFDVAEGYAVTEDVVIIHDLTGAVSSYRQKYQNARLEYTVPEVGGNIPGATTLSGTLTSFGEEGQSTLVQLIPAGEDAAAYSCTVTGNTATYSLTDVQPGTYTLRVSKENHVTREYTVVVKETPVTQDAKICLKGDTTGDGKVNMKDWSRLYDHISETNVLTDYALDCADVTGDGKVNMKDWSRLYGHISETNPLW